MTRDSGHPPPDGGAGWFRRHRGDLLLHGAALGVCLVALLYGVGAVAGLNWPPDVDLYRDIGFAQSMLDGRPLSDPLYLGEWLWYNPLVPALIALASLVSGAPAHVAATQLGPWLNLLAPLGFYLLTRRLLGGKVALAALVAFLFVPVGRFPAWASATYSPWLFPGAAVQGLFYLGLLATLFALRTGRRRHALLAGATLGLTFLGHTAPAVLLGGLSVVLWTAHGLRTKQLCPALGRLGLSLAAAFVVSLPYSGPVLLVYHLDVVNPEPLRWVWQQLALQNLDAFLGANLYPATGLVVAGAVGLWWRRRRDTEDHGVSTGAPVVTVLVGWIVLCGGLVAYGFVWQWLTRQQIEAPVLLPAHHFLLYLKAAELMLVGLGLVTLARAAAAVADKASPRRRALVRNGLYALTLAVTAGISYPIFATREAFVGQRLKAKLLRPSDEVMGLFRWIRTETDPDDVFLADDHYSLHLLSPAGRKVVAMLPFFSNPFAPWKARHKYRHELFSALQLRRNKKFLSLARQTDLDYVLLKGSAAMRVFGSFPNLLERKKKAGNLHLFKVTYPTPPTAEP